MSTLIRSWFLESRYPHAVAAGGLLALAFPHVGVAGLAWVAPALMLGVAAGTDSKQAFRLGYIAGLTYHLVSLYWLLLIPVKFFPILGWLTLSAYLAIYPAVWIWVAWRLWPRRNEPFSETPDPDRITGMAWPPWSERTVWALGVAAMWVALEITRARLLGGFPWNPLGASQIDLVPLLQMSAYTGVYGVSFLVVWFSAALLCTGMGLVRTPTRRSAWLADLAVPLLVTAICFAWGLHRMSSSRGPERIARIGTVQPSIPQTEIWDPAEDEARFAEVIALSELVLKENPDLLLWPEAAVPGLIRWEEDIYSTVANLASSNAIWMIIGADDAARGEQEDVLYYNSAWLIDREGFVRDTYHKQQLVAFGEEVPFNRWLPFLKWFTPITGTFTPGSGFVPFALDDLDLETAILICFEDVFPHLARKAVREETDFLVNLTNDGWFREGAAQRQQAAAAIFRAVENGVPLVRCTNNGMTCWIDEFGRIIETFTDEDGTIYGPGYTVFSVTIPNRAGQGPTFYNRHGDVFGWLCLAVALPALAVTRSWKGRDHGHREGSDHP